MKRGAASRLSLALVLARGARAGARAPTIRRRRTPGSPSARCSPRSCTACWRGGWRGPLGLFEPVALRSDDLPEPRRRSRWRRGSAALDPSAGGTARPGRRRAGARLGHRGHRSSRRRPPSAARTSSTIRAAGSGLSTRGRRGVARQHAAAADGRGAAAARVRDRHAVQHDRAPVDRVAASRRKTTSGLPAFHAGLEAAIAGDEPAARGRRRWRGRCWRWAARWPCSRTRASRRTSATTSAARTSATAGASPFDRGSAVRAVRGRDLRAHGRARRGHARRAGPTVMAFITAADGAGAGRSHAAPLLLRRIAARGRGRRPRHDAGRGDARRARRRCPTRTRGCRGWS